MAVLEEVHSALQVQLLSERATSPAKASRGAAGYQLLSAHDVTVYQGTKERVSLDMVLSMPPGTYGRIVPVNGLAPEHRVDVTGDVIDADYRGPVSVILANHGTNPFHVRQGMCIAQLILERCETAAQVREVTALASRPGPAGGLASVGSDSLRSVVVPPPEMLMAHYVYDKLRPYCMIVVVFAMLAILVRALTGTPSAMAHDASQDSQATMRGYGRFLAFIP